MTIDKDNILNKRRGNNKHADHKTMNMGERIG